MRAVSPIGHADKLARPLLIMHGAKDEIVDVEQSRAMVKALQAAGKPHEYFELPEMGHGGDAAEEAQILNRTIKFFKGCLPPT